MKFWIISIVGSIPLQSHGFLPQSSQPAHVSLMGPHLVLCQFYAIGPFDHSCSPLLPTFLNLVLFLLVPGSSADKILLWIYSPDDFAAPWSKTISSVGSGAVYSRSV